MAIDLFFYSSRAKNDLDEALKLISEEHPVLFAERFLISEAKQANPVHQEIASEHNLNAQSIFLIRVNDKSAVGLIANVVNILKTKLGERHVIALLENEKLI